MAQCRGLGPRPTASPSQGPNRGGGGAAPKPAWGPRWGTSQLCPGASAPLGQSWRQGPAGRGAGRAHRVTTQTSRSEAEDLGRAACECPSQRLPPPDPETTVDGEQEAPVVTRKFQKQESRSRGTNHPGLSGTVPVLEMKVPSPTTTQSWAKNHPHPSPGQKSSPLPESRKKRDSWSPRSSHLDSLGWCTLAPRAGIHCGRGWSGWAPGGRTQPRMVGWWVGGWGAHVGVTWALGSFGAGGGWDLGALLGLLCGGQAALRNPSSSLVQSLVPDL